RGSTKGSAPESSRLAPQTSRAQTHRLARAIPFVSPRSCEIDTTRGYRHDGGPHRSSRVSVGPAPVGAHHSRDVMRPPVASPIPVEPVHRTHMPQTANFACTFVRRYPPSRAP